MPIEIGPITQIQLQDPIFSEVLWKLTPASLAVRLSGGLFKTWNYTQLLSRKLVDVAMGRCPRLIVVMPPRHGKPIAIHETILFGDGARRRLDQVSPEDNVITKLGWPRRVSAIHDQGCLEAIKFTTYSGREVTAALDHPFLTNRGWVNADQLTVNHGLAMSRNIETDPTYTGGDDEQFRLAGYFIGDGSNSHGCVCAYDPEEVRDLVKCGDVLGFKSRYDVIGGGLYFRGGILQWLDDVCLGRRTVSRGKVVPEWVYRSSNEQIAQFVGAYFATDGSISDLEVVRKSGIRTGEPTGCAVEFGSVSRNLLTGVQHLLLRLGIYSRVCHKLGKYDGKPHHSFRLIVSDKLNLERFFAAVPFHHSVKKAKVLAWADHLAKKTARKTKFGVDENYFYDPIITSEPCSVDCRCLTVDVDESFTVNDFVVHNSELVSKWFPVWALENNPHKRVILASYEADFAAKWGGKARDIIAEHQNLLTLRFKSKNPAMHFWETAQSGAMMCAGVGGPITGKGADIFIIDDFVKNSEEAGSLVMREKIWEWYTSTARTRLEPGGAMVVMATRWHADDLIGRLIDPAFANEKGTREQWEVFCFPACAEQETERHYSQFGVKVNDLRLGAIVDPSAKKSLRESIADGESPQWRDILGRKRGEALCPDRYDEGDLARLRGGVSKKDWVALFQQRPGDEVEDGNVYHCFADHVHCKPLTRDENMQLFVALDFNVDPMCCIIGQYDKGMASRLLDRIECLEEIVIPNSNTPSMMEQLRVRLREYQWGYTLDLEIYGDAAGTQRSSQSQKSNWQIVAEYLQMDTSIHYRFLRRKANPMIVDRVNAVNLMLRSADGTVRLYVDDARCPELVKDFKKVKWQVDGAGNATGLLDKGDKKRTHISDALGYAVEYCFALKGKGGSRKGIAQ